MAARKKAKPAPRKKAAKPAGKTAAKKKASAPRPAARKPAKPKAARKPAKKTTPKAGTAPARRRAARKTPSAKAKAPSRAKPARKAARPAARPAPRKTTGPKAEKPARADTTKAARAAVAKPAKAKPEKPTARPAAKAEQPTKKAAPKAPARAAEAAPATAAPAAPATGKPPAPKTADKRGRPGGPGRPRRKIDLFDDMVEIEQETEAEEPLYTSGDDEDSVDYAGEPAEELVLEQEAVATVRRKRRKRPAEEDEVEAPPRKRKKVRRRPSDGMVRPSPPLQQTDPLGAYLAGQMVPCPVGCGGFSEVVRVATLENGSGEVWFECLSCAQRRQFVLPKASKSENADIRAAEEEGRDALCPRHSVPVSLRRRGRQFVCPACGVVFSP